MNILLIAPQPFYIERGTPIAVKLLAQALCSAGHKVDLLTYHEGRDVQLEGLQIHRTPRVPFVNNLPIGFSWKKLLCDFLLSIKALQMISRRRYDVIHAVEESVFIACVLRPLTKKAKLVYDMDSSMPDQLIEKWPALHTFQMIFNAFERFTVKQADVILPVCQALADRVQEYAPSKRVYVLEDVALESAVEPTEVEDIRSELEPDDILALYVGNLEHYQGIDLALKALATLKQEHRLHMVIIGGASEDIAAYAEKATHLGLVPRVHFLGPKPVAHLMQYLQQADILLSPRIKGQNTPMKIYSYLASGRPILATDISSHTQVLDLSCAKLVKPDVADFAKGLKVLFEDPGLRRSLGSAGAEKASKHYTYQAFEAKLREAYSYLTKTQP